MKIFILECDAEELKANRTIMDSVSDAINGFFDAFCGDEFVGAEYRRTGSYRSTGHND